jgi:hypothetical protein
MKINCLICKAKAVSYFYQLYLLGGLLETWRVKFSVVLIYTLIYPPLRHELVSR